MKLEFVKRIGEYSIYYDEDNGEFILYFQLPEETRQIEEYKYSDYLVYKVYDDGNVDLEKLVRNIDPQRFFMRRYPFIYSCLFV